MKRTKQSTFAKRERSEKSTGFAPVGGEDMTHTATHTPGPWLINQVQSEPEKITIIDADMCFVAEVWQTYVNGESRQQENAHLIAAAPGLKNALEDSDALLAELCQYVSTDLQACIVEQRRRNNDLLDAIEGV